MYIYLFQIENYLNHTILERTKRLLIVILYKKNLPQFSTIIFYGLESKYFKNIKKCMLFVKTHHFL